MARKVVILVLLCLYLLCAADAQRKRKPRPPKRKVGQIIKAMEKNITALWGEVEMLSQPVHVHIHGDGDVRDPHDHDHDNHHDHGEQGHTHHDHAKKDDHKGNHAMHGHDKFDHKGHDHGDHDHRDHDRHDNDHHGRHDHEGEDKFHQGEDGTHVHIHLHTAFEKMAAMMEKKMMGGMPGMGGEGHDHHHGHGKEEKQECRPVNCLINPCDSQPNPCPGHQAECSPDYCGGCNAKWTVNGVPVSEGSCPEYRYARCDVVGGNPGVSRWSREDITGTIFLRQMAKGPMEFSVELTGFNVDDSLDESVRYLRGFHGHNFGTMAQGCVSMGGHFNPLGHDHGGPGDHGHHSRHPGDFGNLRLTREGRNYVVKTKFTDNFASLFGDDSLLGRGLVIHTGADDHGKGGDAGSKKTGNAGGRAACCSIIASGEPDDVWTVAN